MTEEEKNKSEEGKSNRENENKETSGEKEEQKAPKENSEENSQNNEEKNRDHLYEQSKGSFTPIVIVMVISLVIAGLWDRVPPIKNAIASVLDPTAGFLLSWDPNWGMVAIALIITFITTIVQKYATDQESLKEIKAEQKKLQRQMKEAKDDKQKMSDLQKKQFKLMPQQMKLGMRGAMFTAIPFILLIRWFEDYFKANPEISLWLGMGWFLFYLLSVIVLSQVWRKLIKVE